MSVKGLSLVQDALLLQREVRGFLDRWREPAEPGDPLPGISWVQLERQLVDLATSPLKKEMASALVSATRKQARFKPAEMVMREILCIAGVLMDESFDPQSTEGAMT